MTLRARTARAMCRQVLECVRDSAAFSLAPAVLGGFAKDRLDRYVST